MSAGSAAGALVSTDSVAGALVSSGEVSEGSVLPQDAMEEASISAARMRERVRFMLGSFRWCENVAVNIAGKQTNSIIATGGGVVTRPENYNSLKQNGIIVFVNRDVQLLATDGRPLSQKYGAKELYEKRLPLYRQFADIEIDGNGAIEEVANRIVKEIVSL